MSICIVDTSVLCNVLRVSGKDQYHREALTSLEEYIRNDTAMLLPMAAIYETGNHIAQQPDGRRRRKVAEAFCEQVTAGLRRRGPVDTDADSPDQGDAALAGRIPRLGHAPSGDRRSVDRPSVQGAVPAEPGAEGVRLVL